jgi:hypothetical protein
MNEEEKQELWSRLRNLDHKINFIGSLVIAGVVWGFAWWVYQDIPSGWGVSKEFGGWIAFAVGCGFSIYFSSKFYKG